MDRKGAKWLGVFLLTLLPLLFIASLMIGAIPLPIDEILEVLWEKLAGLDPAPHLRRTRAILLDVRMPRVLAALFAGSALAISGAAMQGLFQNPMASPDVLGISAGSSLGAVIAIVSGWGGSQKLPLLALAGGLLTALFVYLIASRRGKTHLLFLLLAGLALSSFINGLVSSLLLISEEYEVNQFIHWTMGGLEGRMWKHLLVPLPLILISMVVLQTQAPALNLLSQGEEQAHSLGLSVEFSKVLILIFSALLTAMAISMAGPIGFVGLLVPHLVRLIVGPDHRRLLILSTLSGGVYLMACDLIARRAFAPHEIKTGIITSLIGAPYFIYLILRYQKRGMGR